MFNFKSVWGGWGGELGVYISFIYSGIFVDKMIIWNFTTFAGRQAKTGRVDDQN